MRRIVSLLRMRRTMVLTASMALAVLLGCGVALAATVNCEGGTCVGTRSNDTLFGTPRVDKKFGLGKGTCWSATWAMTP